MPKSIISTTFSIIVSAVIASSCCFGVSAFSKEDYVPRLTEPEKNQEAPEYRFYYSNENIFNKINYPMPNCTAYAWGRAFELLGTLPNLSTGNAGRWYTYNINNGQYAYGCEPKLGAVAVWDKHDLVNGHVAVVEVISDDRNMITVSESQWNKLNFATYTYKSDSSDHMSKYRFLGYMYIDDTSGKFYGDAFKIKSLKEDKIVTCSETLSLNTPLYNTAMQNFRFEPSDNGTYKIWSLSDDVLLSHENDTLSLSSDSESSHTNWKIYCEYENVYSFSPANNENISLTCDETGIILSPYIAGSGQEWELQRVTGISDLTYSQRNNILSLDYSNVRTSYYADDILDISGLVFSINGNPIDEPDISKIRPYYDFTSEGEKKVTIEYGKISADYPVTVITNPEVAKEEKETTQTYTPDITVDTTVTAPQATTEKVVLLKDIVDHIFCTEETTEHNCEYDLNNDCSVDILDIIYIKTK